MKTDWDWVGLGLEISGRGYAKSTFGANKRNAGQMRQQCTVAEAVNG